MFFLESVNICFNEIQISQIWLIIAKKNPNKTLHFATLAANSYIRSTENHSG